MIKLVDPRPLIEVELPSYPGSKVKIRRGIKIGDQISISEKYPNSGDPNHIDAQKSGLEMLAMSIESWNFTDDNDKPLEICLDNILQLGLDDLQVLLAAMQPEEKKK